MTVLTNNYRLILEYDGTRYSGWQKQPGCLTLQGELEQAATKVLGPVKAIAAGRTDAGVHAIGQVVSVLAGKPEKPERVFAALNALLPRDISVASVKRVSPSFHARFNAVSKVYQYRIWNMPCRSVWTDGYSWHIRTPLSLAAMNRAAALLCGRHDFSAFAAAGGNQESKIVRMESIRISRRQGMVFIELKADRFLYKMVRNLVGTLVMAGRSEISPADAGRILESRDRKCAGPTAPPEGLFLKKVLYGRGKKQPFFPAPRSS